METALGVTSSTSVTFEDLLPLSCRSIPTPLIKDLKIAIETSTGSLEKIFFVGIFDSLLIYPVRWKVTLDILEPLAL